jgi:hypothetical protein
MILWKSQDVTLKSYLFFLFLTCSRLYVIPQEVQCTLCIVFVSELQTRLLVKQNSVSQACEDGRYGLIPLVTDKEPEHSEK